MMRNFILLLASLFAMNALAVELPPAFKAHYVVKKGPFELGKAIRELRFGPDGEIIYRSGSDTTGLADLLYSNHVKETTRLQRHGTTVVPIEYQYKRSGKRDRTMSQQFDREQGKVTSLVDAKKYEFQVPDNVIDPNAYQLKLMVELASGTREFSYQVARKGGMRTYDIRHLGDERLKTVYGELDTVVIQRKTSRTTTMWCAPELDFLPVKIQHKEKDGPFTAYLESVEGLQLP